MAKDKAATTPNRATQPNNLTTFYLKKKRVGTALMAIRELQKREDTSGKFARKLGQQRRALAAAAESIEGEREDLVKKHGAKFPAVYPDKLPTGEAHPQAGQPHPQAGEFTPVYATKEDGVSPVYKKDSAGNDTTERIALPDQYNISEPLAFKQDEKDLFEEITVVSCPAFLLTPAGEGSTPELDMFKQIRGAILDPLYDLEEGAETTVKPDGFGPKLVDDAEPKTTPEEPTAEDRSAP